MQKKDLPRLFVKMFTESRIIAYLSMYNINLNIYIYNTCSDYTAYKYIMRYLVVSNSPSILCVDRNGFLDLHNISEKEIMNYL